MAHPKGKTYPTNFHCPDCDVTGSFPGLKRHAEKRHGKKLETVPVNNADLVGRTVAELKAIATLMGVEANGHKKDELVKLLTTAA